MFDRATSIYRSAGAVAVATAGVRKCLAPVVLVQKFVVMQAALPQPHAPTDERLTCELITPCGGGVPKSLEWNEADALVARLRGNATPALALAVARERDRAVGVCLVERDVIGLPGRALPAPWPCLFVHFIGVRADARGRGIGRRLLSFTDGAPPATGARWRLALVAPDNRESLALFGTSGASPRGLVRVVRVLGRYFYELPPWLRRGPGRRTWQ